MIEQLTDAECSWFHFEGRNESVLIKILESLLPRTKYKVSIELEKPARTQLAAAEKLASVLFYSREWAEAFLPGCRTAKQFLESRIPHIAPG